MKTPDEIKKGLECCKLGISWSSTCAKGCPYLNEPVPGGRCEISLLRDALAYIQQLEVERDAAVKDMKNSRDCQCCKHYDVRWDEPCVHCDHDNNRFEWRGVQKEE